MKENIKTSTTQVQEKSTDKERENLKRNVDDTEKGELKGGIFRPQMLVGHDFSKRIIKSSNLITN